MRQTALVVLAMALVPFSAFAVDGQTLINQNTVMAAGGFPYIISLPGSYKLTGNLTISTSPLGNYAGLDIAIGIKSSNVVLDLNGFSITVNNVVGGGISHSFHAIAELGTFHQTSVKNGTITINSLNVGPSTLVFGFGVFLNSSTYIDLEDLSVLTGFFNGASFAVAAGSIVRHNRMSGEAFFRCPSLFVENIGVSMVNANTDGCLGVNNLP